MEVDKSKLDLFIIIELSFAKSLERKDENFLLIKHKDKGKAINKDKRIEEANS